MDGEPAITGADGQTRTLREAAQSRDRPRGEVDPGLGPRPHLQHGREPARLVHLAPARLGRADPGGRLHEVRRGAPHAGARRQGGGGLRAVRRRCLVRAADRGVPARRASTCPSCGGTAFEREHEHPRRLVRLGLEPRSGAVASARARRGRRTCTSKAATSIAAGSRARCSSASARAAGRRSSEVLTHGFLIDVDGRKMSKSLGNTIAAAGRHQGERRRHHPAVGRDERLHARRSASARRS